MKSPEVENVPLRPDPAKCEGYVGFGRPTRRFISFSLRFCVSRQTLKVEEKKTFRVKNFGLVGIIPVPLQRRSAQKVEADFLLHRTNLSECLFEQGFFDVTQLCGLDGVVRRMPAL